MAEPNLSATSPVFEIDGDIKGELGRDCLRLDVEETTAGLKTLAAWFKGHGRAAGQTREGPLYLDGKVLDFGKKLTATIGFGGEARVIFTGYVTGLEVSFHEEQEPAVRVFAEDDLMKLRLTRRMKTYSNVTDADIAGAIADEHGLGVQTDADGPTYDTVQQWNQSDLAFLRDRARKVRAEIWCHDGTLYFQTRDKRKASSMTLIQGNPLISIQVRADLAHQRTAATVSGYDASERDAIDGDAESDAIDAEIESGRTGPSVLEKAFGPFPTFRVREAPLIEKEAKAWARSEFLRRARGFVTACGITHGKPDLVVGSKLTLDRVGKPFDGGGYYAVRVRHTYDLRDGHRTHFVAERPTIGGGS